jgi:hypothetical protein
MPSDVSNCIENEEALPPLPSPTQDFCLSSSILIHSISLFIIHSNFIFLDNHQKNIQQITKRGGGAKKKKEKGDGGEDEK